MRRGWRAQARRHRCASASPAITSSRPGYACGDLGQGGQAALVALDGDEAGGTVRQQGAGEAARAGADLDCRAGGKIAGRPRDASGQVEVEKEMLARGNGAHQARAAR